MENNPLISILSSVHNEDAYIEQTIHSVLHQTYENWEWIILDDGSTDGTRNILKGIDDKRVKCFFNEKTGNIARNLNNALSASCGDIIATIDGDDYWPADKLQLQIKSFDDQGVVLSYGECFLVNSRSNLIGSVKLPQDFSVTHNDPEGTALKRLLVDLDCFICNASVMYRKSSLLSVGGFVEAKGLFQDFPTWVKLSLVGRFSPVPACLGYYRKHLKSASININQKSYFESQLNFLREIYEDNRERLRDIGLYSDISALESHWNRIKIKNKIVYGLISLSRFFKVDFVNPLICFMNRKSRIKRSIERILGIQH